MSDTQTKGETGAPKLLAEYDCDEGRRQLIGQPSTARSGSPTAARADGPTSSTRASARWQSSRRSSPTTSRRRAGSATPRWRAGSDVDDLLRLPRDGARRRALGRPELSNANARMIPLARLRRRDPRRLRRAEAARSPRAEGSLPDGARGRRSDRRRRDARDPQRQHHRVRTAPGLLPLRLRADPARLRPGRGLGHARHGRVSGPRGSPGG